MKYAEQHSGEAAAREYNVDPERVREWKQLASQATTDDKRLHLSGGGRKKVSEELDIFALKNIRDRNWSVQKKIKALCK